MPDVSPLFAVIGGSGLYQFPGLQNATAHEVETPFGRPSAPIVTGMLAGKPVAFLARHGIGHTILPSEINNRANIYALKKMGAQRIIAVSACGSLRDDYAPGHLIVPDQVVDFTRGRARSFFGEGLVAHIEAADPFCASLSMMLYQALLQTGATVHDSGAMITIEGPRFSTKAESHLYRAWGLSAIGMTTCPEIFLAREAGMCYATIAHVTDYDVWHLNETPVNVEMVINTMKHSLSTVQQAITTLAESLTRESTCECESMLGKAFITDTSLIPPETRQKLSLLVDTFLPPVTP
jgi:5'-methylthioadenosine phosphorylase